MVVHLGQHPWNTVFSLVGCVHEAGWVVGGRFLGGIPGDSLGCECKGFASVPLETMSIGLMPDKRVGCSQGYICPFRRISSGI